MQGSAGCRSFKRGADTCHDINDIFASDAEDMKALPFTSTACHSAKSHTCGKIPIVLLLQCVMLRMVWFFVRLIHIINYICLPFPLNWVLFFC